MFYDESSSPEADCMFRTSRKVKLFFLYIVGKQIVLLVAATEKLNQA